MPQFNCAETRKPIVSHIEGNVFLAILGLVQADMDPSLALGISEAEIKMGVRI